VLAQPAESLAEAERSGNTGLNEGISLAICADLDGLAISFTEPLTRDPLRRR
jgi:hypothetical protein